jgi:hypothetical protein
MAVLAGWSTATYCNFCKSVSHLPAARKFVSSSSRPASRSIGRSAPILFMT